MEKRFVILKCGVIKRVDRRQKEEIDVEVIKRVGAQKLRESFGFKVLSGSVLKVY